MGRIGLIAVNAFREVIHQRIVYSVILLAIVVGILAVAPLRMLHMAEQAGEPQMVERMAGGMIASLLGTWGFAAVVLGASLGAKCIAREMDAKTIVTLLSRPLRRGELFLGKWLGVQLFAAAVVVVGVCGAIAVALYLAVPLPLLFWFAAAEICVNVVLSCAISVALGIFLPSSVATGFAIFAPSLPKLMQGLFEGPLGIIARGVYFLMPAAMPVDLLDASFSKELLDPAYGLYAAVLAENALYAAAAMTLAVLAFSQREIRLG